MWMGSLTDNEMNAGCFVFQVGDVTMHMMFQVGDVTMLVPRK